MSSSTQKDSSLLAENAAKIYDFCFHCKINCKLHANRMEPDKDAPKREVSSGPSRFAIESPN